MLLSKEIEVKWNGYTRKWYESKGYKWTKLNDYFICNIKDLQESSTVKVKIKCDYCGKEFEKEYRAYLRQRNIISKDCCSNRKCMVKKSKQINLKKYGVENYRQTKNGREENGKLFRTKKEDVLKIALEKNIEILNIDDYKNDRTRLYIICKNHNEKGIQETNFANIKSNKKCCFYGRSEITGENKRLNGKFVYNEFINKGLIPKFEPIEYKNNYQDLKYICPKHKEKGVQIVTYGRLQQGQTCYYCTMKSKKMKIRLPEEKVFNELIKKGLIPIEGQYYENRNALIYYRCKKHPQHIQYTSFGNFKISKQCCSFCRAEESLTNINRKFRSSIGKWKKESEIYCNYQCILTGNKAYQIHHLVPYNNIIKEALDNLNLDIKQTTKEYTGEEIIKLKDEIIKLHSKYPLGVCLSEEIHTLFHHLYTKNATEEDFYEFKNKYNKGEFDKLLKIKKEAI